MDLQKRTTLEDVKRLYPTAQFFACLRPVRDMIVAIGSLGWYKEWNGFNETLNRVAIPKNVVFQYERCLDDPVEDERRRQIKLARSRALRCQRLKQDELYCRRRSVDRLLDDLGFDDPLDEASSNLPRFVALCEDDYSDSYRPNSRQKRSCCALPSGVQRPRLKRPRLALEAATPQESVVPFPQVTSQSISSRQMANVDLDDSSSLTTAASPKSALYVTFDDDVDDAELLKADTTASEPGPAEDIIASYDCVDDSVLLEAEMCDCTIDLLPADPPETHCGPSFDVEASDEFSSFDDALLSLADDFDAEDNF